MRARLLAFAAAALVSVHAQSNIDPAHAISSSANLGEFNWLPSEQQGAVINQYYCAGFVYGNAVGWISLGSGAPANGFTYRNDSASDYGVNVASGGELSGFAYGANIGWINFSIAGAPRVDWNTGKLSGSAWSANAGWITLADSSRYLRIESLPPLPDKDGDHLPDAWEMEMAGALGSLTAEGDPDGDGQTNRQEYLAGTDPYDPGDSLRVLKLKINTSGTELEFGTKPSYTYRVEQRAVLGSGGWAAAPATAVIGTGSPVTVRVAPTPASLFFYRVVAFPPLSSSN